MLIAGLGGNCKDALADMLDKYSEAQIDFYTDSATDKNIAFFEGNGFRVHKEQKELINYFAKGDPAFISFIGNNYAREKQVAYISGQGGVPSRFISPRSMVNERLVDISPKNAVVMHFANVSAGSVIQEGAIIYAYTAVAHDVIVGKYAFVSAHCAVSNSIIGDYTFVGLNTMIGPGVKVGKHCIIGANSYVKDDLPDNVIAAGSPAKVIRENKR